MKALALLICLIPSLLLAQQSVWDKDANGKKRTNWDNSTKIFTFIDTTSNGSTLTSKAFLLHDLTRKETNFEGLVTFYLEVDSLASATTGKTAGELDTLIFFPEYKLGDLGWVTGDTIVWNQVPTPADTIPTATTTFIITGTPDHGKKWMWRSNGSSTGLQGYAYENLRLKLESIGDSTWVQIKNSIVKY